MNATKARERGRQLSTSSNLGRDGVKARAGVEREVNSDREMLKKEMVGGKRSAAATARTGPRSNAGAETAQKAGEDRKKVVLEITNGAAKALEVRGERSSPVSDSSSASDDEGSTFEEVDEGEENSASSPSLSLEAELGRSSGDVDISELRSKHAHDTGVSGTPPVRRQKKRDVVPMIEIRSRRVHDKGGCNEVESQIPRRSLAKIDNVQGKRERERGNKGKSRAEAGIVVEIKGQGIGDVIVRHRCALEAKSAIEETVWSLVLKYKPYVMDRHLVRALVELWIPELKAFRICRREIPFSVYDVALLTGLPITGKHVTFDQGESACEVEDVWVTIPANYGGCDVGADWDDIASGVELPSGSNRGHKREDPFEEKLADAWVRNNTARVTCAVVGVEQVCFYEHTNLYAHGDEKCVTRFTSWVNLYIGHKYNAAQLILSIKDNQIVPYLEVQDRERTEVTVKDFSDTEDFNPYVKDAQGIISIEERL
ncbi:hypothetical protein Cgig2_024704 [Carnegiea gigantea]|uniref:Uncharacterized protein n=1 Tax=Carnegiea gigantea TaxID=171969 RepID=A0A9Q1JIW3_9CARY|nr:hypothetical protein Cgig2_024704 [Carnegiea gigantea]